MKFTVFTLFPEMFDGFISSSILGRAQKTGLLDIQLVSLRQFGLGKFRQVDDSPFGGGAGCLFRADVLDAAFQSVDALESRPNLLRVYMSPQGVPWTRNLAYSWSQVSKDLHVVILCGHYEGVDERFLEMRLDAEISIGDFVLTGGELPAAVLMDSLVRFIPGVLGNQESYLGDSWEGGTLKYPQYTRPQVWNGVSVPEVLLSGDHRKIAQWRESQRVFRTQLRRPDLLSPIGHDKKQS